MRWRGRRESENIEDERGNSPGRGGGFQFPFPRMGRSSRPLPRGVKTGGISGFGLIIVVVLMLIFGVDPSVLLQGGSPGTPFPQTRQSPQFNPPSPQSNPRSATTKACSDDMCKFIAVVLADTEQTWGKIFSQAGRTYQEPKLRLFTGFVRSACGPAQSASGPFYCPLDKRIYVDLSFFRELRDKFRAPGDFAQAYVIAHEVGHHVQTLMGIAEKVVNYRRRVSQREGNAMQVRMELQADCLAGVWANRAQKKPDFLEKGDIEEALGAASAIGDDRIQRRTQGQVVPDSFTHGSSAQRVRWFKIGLANGKFSSCNTFETNRL